MDRMQLEHVSKFKYLRCIFDESGTDSAVSYEIDKWGRVADAIRSLVKTIGLQLEGVRQ